MMRLPNGSITALPGAVKLVLNTGTQEAISLARDFSMSFQLRKCGGLEQREWKLMPVFRFVG
jgi:hypothetical protein